MALPGDPYPERTPCLFDGCQMSTEEHHRLNHERSLEVVALKRRIAELSRPGTSKTFDLGSVSMDDLSDEIKKRVLVIESIQNKIEEGTA